MGTRKDIAKLGGNWGPSIEWYALAVEAMLPRSPKDRTSWRYLAAIHGFDRANWINQAIIRPSDPLPSSAERARMWDQCQHQGWYFLPWHRGYLAAFEAIVAKVIADLGGPHDWALPYWNYFDTSNPAARRIPQAFLDPTMPNGRPNPLSAPPRSAFQELLPAPPLNLDITLDAMDEHLYTAAPGTIGFGGGKTAFNQFGGLTGALEGNPHNPVHVIVGWPDGYMFDPEFAGLDPIFWLHHCNIDRLWAAWLTRSGNVQENGSSWSDGPFPRRFAMPDAGGQLAMFTPAQTLPGRPLAPTYDDLSIGTGAPTLIAGVDDEQGEAMPATLSDAPPPQPRLLGASRAPVTVGAAGGSTRIPLADAGADIAASPVAERVFLNLENVRGAAPSGVLAVSIGRPATGTQPAGAAFSTVGTVALFGLAKSTQADGPHAGNGISIALDITDFARSLAADAQESLDNLDVRIEQMGAAEGSEITVEKVSIVSQPAR